MSPESSWSILIANRMLSRRTGTELYVRDLAHALQRRGHRPIVYTPEPGALADELRAATVPFVTRPSDLAEAPDLIHGHHALPTMAALLHFVDTPAVYLLHDWSAPYDAPPRFPRIGRYLAVDDTCLERYVERGFAHGEVEVVLNFVDLERFRARTTPLPERPERALLLSNNAQHQGFAEAVRHACNEAGIPLDVRGAGVSRELDAPETQLPRYDLVFAKARAALEAAAVGCAVVVCDAAGLGGMLGSANLDSMRRLNLGRRAMAHQPLDAAGLGRAIAAYDPQDAQRVSARLRETASLEGSVDELLRIYSDVIAKQRCAARDRVGELQAAADWVADDPLRAAAIAEDSRRLVAERDRYERWTLLGLWRRNRARLRTRGRSR